MFIDSLRTSTLHSTSMVNCTSHADYHLPLSVFLLCLMNDVKLTYVLRSKKLVVGLFHSALQRLQDDRFDAFIWMDAVCIDQAHREERAKQFRIMRQI